MRGGSMVVCSLVLICPISAGVSRLLLLQTWNYLDLPQWVSQTC